MNLVSTRHGLTLIELLVVLAILVALAGIVVPLLSNSYPQAQETVTRATMKELRDAVLAYRRDMKGIVLPRAVPGTGLTVDATAMPQTLKDLQFPPTAVDASGTSIDYNPTTQRGWRGPYLMQATGSFNLSNLHGSFASYGASGDLAFVDGWGNPIVLQWPSVGAGSTSNAVDDLNLRILNVRLVSAGAPTVTSGGVTVSAIDTTPNALAGTLTTSLRGNDIVQFLLTQDPYP